MRNLEELVSEYNQLKVSDFHDQQSHYQNLSSLDEAINHACFGLYIVDLKIFFSNHYENVFLEEKKVWMYEVRDKLLSLYVDVFFWKGKEFHEFYIFLRDEILKMKGIGPLLLYDISLRLSWFLKIKTPSRLYAQRGARWGLEALYELDHNSLEKQEPIIEDYTKMVSQYGVFEQLKDASHLENFLCIYRKDLRKLK